MVCEGGRPCNRWSVVTLEPADERSIKREIADKCRDEAKPQQANASAGPSRASSAPQVRLAVHAQTELSPAEDTKGFDPGVMPPAQYFQPDQPLYPDVSLPPSWPMLPDTASYDTADASNGLMGMLSKGAAGGQAEFGILSYVAR